jgi:asparagine synthetase A
VITIINNKVIQAEHFIERETGAVFLNDIGARSSSQHGKTGRRKKYSSISKGKAAMGACTLCTGFIIGQISPW